MEQKKKKRGQGKKEKIEYFRLWLLVATVIWIPSDNGLWPNYPDSFLDLPHCYLDCSGDSYLSIHSTMLHRRPSPPRRNGGVFSSAFVFPTLAGERGRHQSHLLTMSPQRHAAPSIFTLGFPRPENRAGAISNSRFLHRPNGGRLCRS